MCIAYIPVRPKYSTIKVLDCTQVGIQACCYVLHNFFYFLKNNLIYDHNTCNDIKMLLTCFMQTQYVKLWNEVLCCEIFRMFETRIWMNWVSYTCIYEVLNIGNKYRLVSINLFYACFASSNRQSSFQVEISSSCEYAQWQSVTS